MGSNELSLITIFLFVSPIIGVLLGFCLDTFKLGNLRRFRILPPLIAFVSSFILFLNFVFTGAEGAIEYTFLPLGVFNNTPVSFNLQPLSSILAFIISTGFLLLNLGIHNYHRDMLTLNEDLSESVLSQRLKGFAIYGNCVFFSFLIMIFSSSSILFMLGFSLISVALMLVPGIDIKGKSNFFKANLIADFILIIAFAVFFTHLSSFDLVFETFVSISVLIALIIKLAIPPARLTKQIHNHELKILFLTFVRPTLIILVLLRFNEIFFINTFAGIFAITVITLILINSLISLFRNNNSLEIIENISTFSISALFLISVHGYHGTQMLYFTGILAANILLGLSFLVLTARSNSKFTDLDESSRFSLNNFGELRGRFSILMFSFIISTLCIAGAIPFIGGWTNFSVFKHITSDFTGYRVILNLLAFIILNIAFILFIAAFSSTIHRIFFGKFRGKPEQLILLNLPDKKILAPVIILALFILIGGIINMPGNTSISGFLTTFISGSPDNQSILTENLMSEFSNTDFTVMILFFAVPVLALILSLYLHSLFQDKTLKFPRRERFDIIYRLESNMSKIKTKIEQYIRISSDFAYTIIDRLIIHSIFWLFGRCIIFVSKILRKDVQNHENYEKAQKIYFVTIIILIILAVLIALSAC